MIHLFEFVSALSMFQALALLPMRSVVKRRRQDCRVAERLLALSDQGRPMTDADMLRIVKLGGRGRRDHTCLQVMRENVHEVFSDTFTLIGNRRVWVACKKDTCEFLPFSRLFNRWFRSQGPGGLSDDFVFTSVSVNCGDAGVLRREASEYGRATSALWVFFRVASLVMRPTIPGGTPCLTRRIRRMAHGPCRALTSMAFWGRRLPSGAFALGHYWSFCGRSGAGGCKG